MVVADAANARFEIGRVATRTFEVIRANFVSFFILGLIATLPTTFYTVMVSSGMVLRPGLGGGAGNGLLLAGTFGSAFVGFLFALVLQATLTYGTVSYLSNQPVVLGRALGIGLREFFPLLAIGILESLGALGGFILLIVPGFIFLLMWAVVVPVRVAEHKGIFESFGRSRELTSGFRWPILGTLFIYFIGAGIAQAATRPMIAFGGINGNSAMFYAGTVLNALVGAIIAVASATLIACIYYELRVIKEGVGPEQIAAVFD
jgi:hypothetical protein